MRVALNAMIGDCFHEGHQNLLRKMKEYGDVIVVLHDDLSCYKIKGKFPIQSLERRKWQLENSGLVSKVIVTDNVDPGYSFLDVIRDFGSENITYLRGDDLKDFPGKWALDNNEVKIEFVEYTKGVSSTQIRKDIAI